MTRIIIGTVLACLIAHPSTLHAQVESVQSRHGNAGLVVKPLTGGRVNVVLTAVNVEDDSPETHVYALPASKMANWARSGLTFLTHCPPPPYETDDGPVIDVNDGKLSLRCMSSHFQAIPTVVINSGEGSADFVLSSKSEAVRLLTALSTLH